MDCENALAGRAGGGLPAGRRVATGRLGRLGGDRVEELRDVLDDGVQPWGAAPPRACRSPSRGGAGAGECGGGTGVQLEPADGSRRSACGGCTYPNQFMGTASRQVQHGGYRCSWATDEVNCEQGCIM
ncbi:hypothetical protein DIPPA_17890 [Diplonema papillatum]|nr:hypothetical protein DIPPA_17890 [Diplonema papillatum]